ncbi:unnamed protein product [Leptidea sinapis]|uniref:Endonuclease/exonuclease/phosphatase domain-containing protein n=1 Tax=Leptidea sinapis TaxID=189913 RepID=A0A5E4R8K6_9NEOP|nr:unnamed protein product [Leptidea sinapis]
MVTFNCRSLKRSIEHVRSLCRFADILALQETWLLPHDHSFVNEINDEFACFAKSSVGYRSENLLDIRFSSCSDIIIQRQAQDWYHKKKLLLDKHVIEIFSKSNGYYGYSKVRAYSGFVVGRSLFLFNASLMATRQFDLLSFSDMLRPIVCGGRNCAAAQIFCSVVSTLELRRFD